MMKDLNFCNLLDAYGALLTQKQRDILSGFYNDDLSLTELGENFCISRQAVLDAVKKGEGILLRYEDALQVCKKNEAIKQSLQRAAELLEQGECAVAKQLLEKLTIDL